MRAALRMPIATGENDAIAYGFREIVAAGAADIAQPSVTKIGGLGADVLARYPYGTAGHRPFYLTRVRAAPSDGA